jgi:4-amino-4-deoxy-L-arabinose transferase-like glycosyltransferase
MSKSTDPLNRMQRAIAPDTMPWKNLSTRQKEYLALALITLLAAVLRFYRLEAIPVGLSGDEAEDGYVAKRILRGEEYPIFIEGTFGEEPVHTYLVAVSFAVWGASLWAVRFFPAVLGVITVPMVFWLAKELFPKESNSAGLVGLFSAFLMATSYWHIIYSRFGLEVITLPLLSSAIIFFLSRGIRSASKWPFVVSGLLLGGSLYTYRGARFFLIFFFLIVGGWLLASREFRRLHFANLALLAAVALAVYFPLGMYAVSHPEIYFDRELHVSILNPEWEQGSPGEAFAKALIKTAGMFNVSGDPEFDRNPGKRPVLDPLSSLFFFAGLGVVVSRWRRANYSLVLLWFLIMSLPGAFTAEVAPHFHRGIGALPPLVLLCALGAVSAKDWLDRKTSKTRPRVASLTVLAVSFLLITLLSCGQYFPPWQRRLAAQDITGGGYIEATELMNTRRIPDGVWVLPASSLRPRNIPYYEAYFLYDGPEPAYTVFADDVTTPSDLSDVCQGHSQAAVINWKEFVLEEAYESLDSDPKGLIDFLLRKYGQRLSQEPHESFDLITYRMPDNPEFAIADSFAPTRVDFGGALRLEGVALGGSSPEATSTPKEVDARVLPSAEEGWVALRWRALSELEADYKVAAYLLDGRGRIVGQVDKLLMSNHLETTSHWDAGQLEVDYYTLPCQPATPPGAYTVVVSVYNTDTMERLPVFDAQTGASSSSVVVGQLQVTKPLTPPEVKPLQELPAAQANVAPGLRLLGYDMPVTSASPGESVRLALYWRAVKDMSRDYVLSLELENADRVSLAEQRGYPVDGTYPTSEWEAGEVIRDWHDLNVPPDLPSGRYDLFLQILESGEIVGQVGLGSIEVRGRPHQFDVPDIQHPLEAHLGNDVVLLGYDLSSEEVGPGGTLNLVLYWQAEHEIRVSHTVFTHLLGTDGRIWAQMDSIPLTGGAPTTSWLAGEVLVDEYQLILDPQAPPGTYEIEIGMYDSNSGRRLAVWVDGTQMEGDRMLLGEVRVTE